MINLLSDTSKKQIQAARWNVSLFRYLVLLGFAAIFMAGFAAITYVTLGMTKQAAQSQIDYNTKKAGKFTTAQDELATFRGNLSTAQGIIGQSVSYSTILIDLAQALPAGVVIDTITLSPTTFGTPIVLPVHAKSKAVALTLQQSFQNSTLFSNVTIGSIVSDPANSSNPYPVTVSLNLTINKVGAQ